MAVFAAADLFLLKGFKLTGVCFGFRAAVATGLTCHRPLSNQGFKRTGPRPGSRKASQKSCSLGRRPAGKQGSKQPTKQENPRLEQTMDGKGRQGQVHFSAKAFCSENHFQEEPSFWAVLTTAVASYLPQLPKNPCRTPRLPKASISLLI